MADVAPAKDSDARLKNAPREDDGPWMIRSHYHSMWHCRSAEGHAAGYTSNIERAGIFGFRKAAQYHDWPGGRDEAVPLRLVVDQLRVRLAEIDASRNALAATIALLSDGSEATKTGDSGMPNKKAPPMMDTKATSPTPPPALLERLRAASGPDPQLDRDLGALFGLGPGDDRTRDPWPYTGSADAALALVDRALPGWIIMNLCEWDSDTLRAKGPWMAQIKRRGAPALTDCGDCRHAPTASLAVLIALLTALQAQQEEGR